MARRPSVRYWPSRGGYCCEYQGKLVVLAKGPDDALHGPVYNAALKAFSALIMGQKPAPKGSTYSQLWERYKTANKRDLEESTLRQKAIVIDPFMERFGELLPEQIETLKIAEWIEEKRTPRAVKRRKKLMCWGDSTVHLFWSTLHALLAWGVQNKLVSEVTIKGQKKPRKRSRGEDAVLDPEEHQRIIDAENVPTWRDYWTVLHGTGARPGEIAAAEAKHYDPELQAFIFRKQTTGDDFKHKNQRHGVDRIIRLAGEALRVVERRMKEHPTGRLFGHAPKGYRRVVPGMTLRPWKTVDIVNRARDIREKTGITKFIAYAYRHSFVTRWLLNDKSVEKLAVLLGTSPSIIHSNYSHLFRYKSDLRRELEDFQVSETLIRVGTAQTTDKMGNKINVGLMD